MGNEIEHCFMCGVAIEEDSPFVQVTIPTLEDLFMCSKCAITKSIVDIVAKAKIEDVVYLYNPTDKSWKDMGE